MEATLTLQIVTSLLLSVFAVAVDAAADDDEEKEEEGVIAITDAGLSLSINNNSPYLKLVFSMQTVIMASISLMFSTPSFFNIPSYSMP